MAKAKIMEFQKDAVRGIEQFGGRALLRLRMGAGKTLVTLRWLHRHPEAWPAVVVCPNSVKAGWEREAANNLGVRATVLEGRPPKRQQRGLLKLRPQLVVLNYDILAAWASVLRLRKFQTVIIDECQELSNPSSQRSRAAARLCKGVPHVIALSGTPLRNRPADLWATLRILRPDEFGQKLEFMHRYCGPVRSRFGWEFKGACNIQELRGRLLGSCMVQPKPGAVSLELPPCVRRPVLLSCDLRPYQQEVDRFKRWLSQQDGALGAQLRQGALAFFGRMRQLIARQKAPSVLEWARCWLDDNPQRAKLVIFAHHRAMLSTLHTGLPQGRPVLLDGTQSHEQRKRSVIAFREDPEVRLAICGLRAAGTGLDGLQVASSLAFAELDPSPTIHAQATARIWRLGQQRRTWVFWLLAAHTIDEPLCRMLQRKQRAVSELLEGDAAADALPIFDELQSAIAGDLYAG